MTELEELRLEEALHEDAEDRYYNTKEGLEDLTEQLREELEEIDENDEFDWLIDRYCDEFSYGDSISAYREDFIDEIESLKEEEEND